MLSVFLLVGGIFLGNCMPEEPPRLCTLRPLLSCKFIEAPYPGGVNSKVGKSRGLSRCPPTRAQNPVTPDWGCDLKRHLKGCIRRFPHSPPFHEGLQEATTMWLFYLLFLYTGARKSPRSLSISFLIYKVIYACYIESGKCKTRQRKKIRLNSIAQKSLCISAAVYFQPLYFFPYKFYYVLSSHCTFYLI